MVLVCEQKCRIAFFCFLCYCVAIPIYSSIALLPLSRQCHAFASLQSRSSTIQSTVDATKTMRRIPTAGTTDIMASAASKGTSSLRRENSLGHLCSSTSPSPVKSCSRRKRATA